MSRKILVLALFAPGVAYAGGSTQVLAATGRYTFSVDGWGNSTSSSGSVTINKPTASSTVYKVYASVTTIPSAGDPGASILRVGGTAVTLSQYKSDTYFGSIYTRFDDITASVSSAFDAMPAGANSVSLSETAGWAARTDGTALYVVWEDATNPITTVALSIGVELTYYSPTITLAVDPIDTSVKDFKVISGAAISYSTGVSPQISSFYFNGTRLTTSAGGYDDGTLANGALFTVGGDGDALANEKFDLTSFVSMGETSLEYKLVGSSPDDYCVGIWAESHGVSIAASEYCGDGIVNGVEECDDGNSDDTDGCSNLCIVNCDDADGDGYLDDTCGGDDCDDANSAVHPGATEVCNGLDDDCDGAYDEAGAVGETAWYEDVDADTYGNPVVVTMSCEQPPGFVANDDDCDDTDPSVHAYGVEIPYDGIDQDCDGSDLIDADGDGWTGEAGGGDDCDDSDSSVHPTSSESADGVDEDCDGTLDEGTAWGDDDGDGVTEAGGDCDDAAADAVPGAEEVADGLDNDCDGRVDEETSAYDDDGDGYSEDSGDCNDADRAVTPGRPEIDGNGVDDDCDGTVDDGVLDDDGDGTTEEGGDCAPTDGDIHPGAAELPNGLDDDCDGEIDEGTSRADDDGDGVTEDGGDCDDSDASVNPSAEEIVNGRDDDCDGELEEGTTAADDDGDGWTEAAGDCDDADAGASPDAEEVGDNGVDEDCDGDADEVGDDADGDGYSAADGDCDDASGWAHPGLVEACDGIDNNCDGVADENCEDLDADKPGDGAGCGCGGAGPMNGLALGLAALFGWRRRR